MRIDYAAREPGAASKAHFAACGFGGTTFERDRLDLVAVETDEGALGEARLLYLKRFWLSEAEREGVAPPAPEVPQIPAAAAYALQQLVNALALAAVYALLATAYSLIYGLVGRINLAFGEIAVLGAYGAIGGVAAAVALGDRRCDRRPCAGLRARGGDLGRLERAGRPRRGRAAARAPPARPADPDRDRRGRAFRAGVPAHHPRRARALDAAGVQSADRACARAGFHRDRDADADRGGAARPCGAGGVLSLLGRTRFGRAWRAFADDPGTAALFGVDGRRLLASTFLLAGLLAGLSGWIVAAYYGNVSFSMGAMLGLKALVAAVVGGIGSVPGAFLGGVCVALIEAMWSAYFDITARDIVVFSLLIVVFVLRPGGLLGFAGPEAAGCVSTRRSKRSRIERSELTRLHHLDPHRKSGRSRDIDLAASRLNLLMRRRRRSFRRGWVSTEALRGRRLQVRAHRATTSRIAMIISARAFMFAAFAREGSIAVPHAVEALLLSHRD